jgi:hypothetical protein
VSQVRREWIYRRATGRPLKQRVVRKARGRNDQTDTIDGVRQHISELLDGDLAPYEAGAMICAHALGRETGQWPWLWLLWATLTAPCGGGHTETLRAEDTMRRAAAEWLEVSAEETRWRRYFDHWLCDELGWPKTSNPSQAGQSTGRSSTSTMMRPNIYPRRLVKVESTDVASGRSTARRHCK